MGAAQIKKLYYYVIKQAIQGGNVKDGVKEFNNSKIRKKCDPIFKWINKPIISNSLHILLDKLDTNSLYLKIMQLNIFVRNLKTHTLILVYSTPLIVLAFFEGSK